MNRFNQISSWTAFVVALVLTPSGLSGADRMAWTSSRILGSPEPPLPYVSERVMHDHRFVNTTEMDFIPGTSWAVILDQGGKMHVFDRTSPGTIELIANFAERNGGRTEAYSIEFHPGWKTNHLVFIAMLDRSVRPPHVRVVRFELLPTNPPVLEMNSARSVIDWESAGHNGSDLRFGPDGFLYISSGDGDSPAPPDPRETGQNVSDLLAGILRIDVDHEDGDKSYRVPTDNPFEGEPNIRPEVWAYGLRNPWKMAFDPRDGALWVGDVGWELWEMVFRIDHGGFNGGWSIVEGPQSIHPDWPLGPTPIEKPVISHSHSEATSITGGFVYRGSRLPGLRDAYIYGDWGSGKIWALWWDDGLITKHEEIASTPHRIVSFAEDENHELFYMDYANGGVYRLVPNPDQKLQRDFPTHLSETGLLTSTEDYKLAPGVYGFDITAPMWSDHATARRAVAYPNVGSASSTQNYFESPTNSVFVRTISMEMESGNPDSSRRIETQILHFDGLDWRGYSYRWNEDQTDAELVGKNGDVTSLTIADPVAPGGKRVQTWRFHSRAECSRCHQVAYRKKHGNLNGFSPLQLASLKTDRGASELNRLIQLGIIEESAAKSRSSKLINPHDKNASLNLRARSYLHANCAHCHRPGSTGAVTMYWPVDFPKNRTGAFDVAPERGAFGIADARIVAPGRPDHSTLLYRMLTTGTGRMPLIGSHEVDDEGVDLLNEWITSFHEKSGDGKTIREVASLDDTASAVAAAVKAGSLSEPERNPLLAVAMESSNVFTRDLFQRFLPPGERRPSLGAGFDPAFVLTRTGDRERGRELFFGATGPQCFSCHRKNGRGRDFGPDLSNVDKKYTRELLLLHIAKPNMFVDAPWHARSIETNDDESYTGFVIEEDSTKIVIRTALGTATKISKARVTSDIKLTTSLMPEGTIDTLTPQEAADLLEFLSR